jgi:IS30 family transposase
MAKLGRPGMSGELRAQLWQLRASGKSFSEISQAIGHPPGSIFTIVKQTGGYVPLPRRRRPGILSLWEREEISRGLARGDALRQLARTLGRPPLTVSREVARNRGGGRYRAVDADDRAWRRAKRPKACLLAKHPELRAYVAARLREDWSPEQIAGALQQRYPAESRMRISHETIYRSLFVQARGVLAKELLHHLRSGRLTRRNIHHTVTGQWRSQITDAVSIHQRPAEANDRAIPGHWEGDRLLGRHWTQIGTVVERSTRFTVLVQLDGRDMATVTEGLSRTMARLPKQLRKSLTWDRGMESAGHQTVTARTGLAVYFADPRSPWQRGTNENTNRLLRQYLPKGVSMAGLTQDDLDTIAARLNSRPRKTLGYDTPADRLEAALR